MRLRGWQATVSHGDVSQTPYVPNRTKGYTPSSSSSSSSTAAAATTTTTNGDRISSWSWRTTSRHIPEFIWRVRNPEISPMSIPDNKNHIRKALNFSLSSSRTTLLKNSYLFTIHDYLPVSTNAKTSKTASSNKVEVNQLKWNVCRSRQHAFTHKVLVNKALIALRCCIYAKVLSQRSN